jgi:hypothetical protein
VTAIVVFCSVLPLLSNDCSGHLTASVPSFCCCCTPGMLAVIVLDVFTLKKGPLSVNKLPRA